MSEPKRKRTTSADVGEYFANEPSTFDQIAKSLGKVKKSIVDTVSAPEPVPVPTQPAAPKELDNPLPYRMVRDLAGTPEGTEYMKQLRKVPVDQQQGQFMQIMEQMKRKQQGQ